VPILLILNVKDDIPLAISKLFAARSSRTRLPIFRTITHLAHDNFCENQQNSGKKPARMLRQASFLP
jgi:hypothetical protein